MLSAMIKIVTPGLDPGGHLKKKMMDGRVAGERKRRRSGRLCPAVTAESSL
jgi:hypothetical protein